MLHTIITIITNTRKVTNRQSPSCMHILAFIGVVNLLLTNNCVQSSPLSSNHKLTKRSTDSVEEWLASHSLNENHQSHSLTSTGVSPCLLEYESQHIATQLEREGLNSEIDFPSDAYIVPLSAWLAPENPGQSHEPVEETNISELIARTMTSQQSGVRRGIRHLAGRRNRESPIRDATQEFFAQQARLNGNSLDVLGDRTTFNMTVENQQPFENIPSSKLMEIILIMRSDCSTINNQIIRWVSGQRGILFECKNGVWVLNYLRREQSRVRPMSVKDCHELHEQGEEFFNPNQVHEVQVNFTDNKIQKWKVLCRHVNDPDDHQRLANSIPQGGSGNNRQSEAWTVIQRRVDGDTNFYRSNRRYKRGFGSPRNGEYWLGLEPMFVLTHTRRYSLRMEITTNDDQVFISEYDDFKVSNEQRRYKLKLGRFMGPQPTDPSGTLYAGDLLSLHNNGEFHTKDNPTATNQRPNCGRSYVTGFWFRGCWAAVNLNGPYSTTPATNRGVRWATEDVNEIRRVKKTELMIKPVL